VGLAARGARKLGDVVEQIEAADELTQVRHQARRVRIKALVVAISLTLLALALPALP
jgi:hypothetical protein